MAIELESGPQFEWEAGSPVAVTLSFRVCETETQQVVFEWRSELPELGGVTPPQRIGADQCVRFRLEVPPHEQSLAFALYDADRRDAGPVWQYRGRLSLAAPEPRLVPPAP